MKKKWLCPMLAGTLLVLSACSGGSTPSNQTASVADSAASEASVEASAEASAEPEEQSAGEIVYLHVEAPEASSPDGVVTAEDWRAIYPDIVASIDRNLENTYRVSYLEQDPYLVNLYEGFGFAKDYGSAIGHGYQLEDVHETQRPHALANCLTCKTPNFTKLVNDNGVEAYTYDFEETWEKMTESVSCYNCHGNEAGDGGKLVVTHSYLPKALGSNIDTIKSQVLACGQCHIEYYFDPDTKETSFPASDIASMHPTKILAFYDEMDYADWTQESTGTRLLKTQHPEMETFLLGKHGNTLTCADCHMALETAEDGSLFHSHNLQSPLDSEILLATCVRCHGDEDMTAKVHAIQDEITAREREVGEKLSDMKDKLAAVNAAGELDEDTLEQIRSLHRTAQWYFDFSYVENSEGAHNSALAKEILDLADQSINEALQLLGE